MKIQSNVLTDKMLGDALVDAKIQGVYVDVRSSRRGRNFTFSHDVTLFALPGADAEGQNRRVKNTGTLGAAGYRYAATYREHGWWMRELFALDPDAHVARYKGADDFHNQTFGDFEPTRAEAIAIRAKVEQDYATRVTAAGA